MSIGEPNSPQKALAQQQHDLLTPFNHIVGYCDLLLEDPSFLTQPAIVADLQVIRAEGLQALDLLHTGLAASTQTVDLTQVQPQITVLLVQILTRIAQLRAIATTEAQPELANDLGRIRTAVERFLMLSAQLVNSPNQRKTDG